MRTTARGWRIVAFLLALAGLATQNTAEASFTTLYRLDGGADGMNPEGPLALKAGALYIAASQGGSSASGVILRLTPPATGTTWRRARIHTFTGGLGGANPFSVQSLDTSTALYGVTVKGGNATNPNCPSGCGAVFKLTPPAVAGSPWAKTVIHRFRGGNDGISPHAGLIRGPDGAIYGTTEFGGGQLGSNCTFYDGCGTVFRLKPPASGSLWTETVLHSFKNDAGGGWPLPGSGVVRDSAGVLYGAAGFGGRLDNCITLLGLKGCGVVFSLTPPTGAGTVWTKKILHTFTDHAGAPGGIQPSGSLVRDSTGALYGTTALGGTDGNGVVFKLIPPAAPGQQWTKRILYRFKGGADGATPISGLVRVASGALYGTTAKGGTSANCSEGCGTIFKLAPAANPAALWIKTTLHNFNKTNGASPGPLVPTTGGAFYGLTQFGGNTACTDGCGTVFKWSP